MQIELHELFSQLERGKEAHTLTQAELQKDLQEKEAFLRSRNSEPLAIDQARSNSEQTTIESMANEIAQLRELAAERESQIRSIEEQLRQDHQQEKDIWNRDLDLARAEGKQWQQACTVWISLFIPLFHDYKC